MRGTARLLRRPRDAPGFRIKTQVGERETLLTRPEPRTTERGLTVIAWRRSLVQSPVGCRDYEQAHRSIFISIKVERAPY